MKNRINEDERLLNFNHYCCRMKIELYGGNDVIKAFETIWALSHTLNLGDVSFICNGRKITIEKIKT
jgi:hypothetical protein